MTNEDVPPIYKISHIVFYSTSTNCDWAMIDFVPVSYDDRSSSVLHTVCL